MDFTRSLPLGDRFCLDRNSTRVFLRGFSAQSIVVLSAPQNLRPMTSGAHTSVSAEERAQRLSAVRLSRVGSRCWINTKAAPLSAGMALKNFLKVSSPPAEALMPTRTWCAAAERRARAGNALPRRAPQRGTQPARRRGATPDALRRPRHGTGNTRRSLGAGAGRRGADRRRPAKSESGSHVS